MDVIGKSDADQAAQRLAAWWEGEVVDRAVVQVTAPRAGLTGSDLAPLQSPVGLLQVDDMLAWFIDPEQVLPRLEQHVASTFWGGEAIPVVFPVSISLVAILAAYLGCPYSVTSGTGWAEKNASSSSGRCGSRTTGSSSGSPRRSVICHVSPYTPSRLGYGSVSLRVSCKNVRYLLARRLR